LCFELKRSVDGGESFDRRARSSRQNLRVVEG
jgi:hypothetical protein